MVKRTQKHILSSLLILVLFSINCFAIQVRVQSTSYVSALGFKVNGRCYGCAGSFFYTDDAPLGNYIFGLRANGIFSDDITCMTNNGVPSVFLNKNTTAILDYDGRRCILWIHNGDGVKRQQSMRHHNTLTSQDLC